MGGPKDYQLAGSPAADAPAAASGDGELIVLAHGSCVSFATRVCLETGASIGARIGPELAEPGGAGGARGLVWWISFTWCVRSTTQAGILYVTRPGEAARGGPGRAGGAEGRPEGLSARRVPCRWRAWSGVRCQRADSPCARNAAPASPHVGGLETRCVDRGPDRAGAGRAGAVLDGSGRAGWPCVVDRLHVVRGIHHTSGDGPLRRLGSEGLGT